MRVYENKEELKKEISKTFEKYIMEFNNIPENLKDKRIDEVDRTPAENLSYQVGWTNLVNYISGSQIPTLIYLCKS